jgi:Protein of unknown function (DUF2846)
MKSSISRQACVVTLFTIFAMVLAAGCATVPMAEKEKDTAVKTFTPKPEKAQIYVYRNEALGSALTMTVSLDGKVIGRTGPKTFFWWEVEPGIHVIGSHTENVSELHIKTEAGKLYFVWQEVKMGWWSARSVLRQVDEETGKLGVMECELIQ